MRKNYSRYFLTVTVFQVLLCLAMPAYAGQTDLKGGTAAVVNGKTITMEDLDREINHVREKIASTGRTLDPSQMPLLKKQALEGIIGSELLYQETLAMGIKVDKGAINKKWEELKNKFSGEAELQDALKKMGLSEDDFRLQIERGMAIQQLIDKMFVQKISVSAEEVRAYYDGNPDKFKRPAQVKASHILIRVDPGADESAKKASRSELERIQKRVKKGEDFAALAREFSQGPTGIKGGDLGYFSRGRMVKSFEEAAFALNPGDVSGIVETRFGYHLIKVTDKREEGVIGFDEVKDRLHEGLKRVAVQEEVGKHVAELRKKADLEIFLK